MMREAFDKVRYKMDDAAIGLFGSSYINVEKANDILDEVLAESKDEPCVWTPYRPYTKNIYTGHGTVEVDTELKRWTYCKHCGKKIIIKSEERISNEKEIL